MQYGKKIDHQNDTENMNWLSNPATCLCPSQSSTWFFIGICRGLLVRLWLLCLTPLSTIFQLYRGGHFHWCRKPEYAEKTTDLPQVTEKLYTLSHNAVSSTPRLNGIRTHWYVIGTDCIDSCKSNYHTTAPDFSIVFWNCFDSVVFLNCSDSVVF